MNKPIQIYHFTRLHGGVDHWKGIWGFKIFVKCHQTWLAGKLLINGGFNGNPIYKWGIFNCHVWLPEGRLKNGFTLYHFAPNLLGECKFHPCTKCSCTVTSGERNKKKNLEMSTHETIQKGTIIHTHDFTNDLDLHVEPKKINPNSV